MTDKQALKLALIALMTHKLVLEVVSKFVIIDLHLPFKFDFSFYEIDEARTIIKRMMEVQA